ncbi:MAG TPA: branched-chain amino acid ABC transporter permease [Acetobacteraceae bacterium]|nr:branched-chain amino acid ABC transporter permease [Acetobacteraceae bacterium]
MENAAALATPAARTRTPSRMLAWAALLAFAAVVPTLLASNYQLFQLTMVAVYAIAILGLNIVTGFNGQISLGHGAFFAIGAYVTAILMSNYDWPYWLTLPVAGVACGVVGYLLGFPALRLGGLYLALTTLALAVATPQLLKYKLLEDWTGGVQGVTISKPDPPFGLPLSQDQWLYLFALAVGAVLFLLTANLVTGRIGRAMRAIRDHPLAAEAMGIDVAQFKTRTFAVGAALTGIGGALDAVAVQFVSPDSFGSFLSIVLFVGLVVGGVGSIPGTILGAVFIEFVPLVAQGISDAAPGAVYGAILIAFLFLLPSGVAGMLRSGWTRLAKTANAIKR